MSYFVLGMGATDPERWHVWDAENVDWIEPDEWNTAAALDPMEAHAPSLKAFLRRGDGEVCPACALALENRHSLPDSYRTETLDERIGEYQRERGDEAVKDAVSPADIKESIELMKEQLDTATPSTPGSFDPSSGSAAHTFTGPGSMTGTVSDVEFTLSEDTAERLRDELQMKMGEDEDGEDS